MFLANINFMRIFINPDYFVQGVTAKSISMHGFHHGNASRRSNILKTICKPNKNGMLLIDGADQVYCSWVGSLICSKSQGKIHFRRIFLIDRNSVSVASLSFLKSHCHIGKFRRLIQTNLSIMRKTGERNNHSSPWQPSDRIKDSQKSSSQALAWQKIYCKWSIILICLNTSNGRNPNTKCFVALKHVHEIH